jgi:O-antigen ligase
MHSSVSIRLPLLRVAWELFRKRPWFGWGSGVFGPLKFDIIRKLHKDGKWNASTFRGEFCHCEPVDLLYEYGVVGALLWLCAVGSVLLRGGPYVPMVLAVLVVSLTYFPLRRPGPGLAFWVLLGMVS